MKTLQFIKYMYLFYGPLLYTVDLRGRVTNGLGSASGMYQRVSKRPLRVQVAMSFSSSQETANQKAGLPGVYFSVQPVRR